MNESSNPVKTLIKIMAVAYRSGFLAAVFSACFFSLPAAAQQPDSPAPASVVQPGAPGEPTRSLPSSTRGVLPPRAAKDVEFMQGMIMHHGQAVEMTAMIEARTGNKALRLLGARISHTQADEIRFMKRWLEARGEPPAAPMAGMEGMDMPGMNMSGHQMGNHQMLMPGMLTPKQMDALRKAKGAEFDRLFLTGMIQHHTGALTMVKEMFAAAGGGQDAELFNFATDVDGGQRAEIRIMENMLENKP